MIFLGLQVMVASNYIQPLGVLPRLPSFLNLNWFAWKMVLSYVILEGRKKSLPVMAKQLGVPEEEVGVEVLLFFVC